MCAVAQTAAVRVLSTEARRERCRAAKAVWAAQVQVAAEHAVEQTAAVVRVLSTEVRRKCCRAATKAVAVQTAAARVVATEAYREGC